MRMMAALLGTAVVALGVTASADPVDDYVRSQLAARRLPGVALAVVKDGRVVKAAGYGVASLELNVPVSPDTVFEIGSISKQFAANAILLLVEDGKVRLDDPISTYLARTPPAWSAITIRHILTHTSGLADFDSGNIGFSYRREYTADEFVELLEQAATRLPAGGALELHQRVPAPGHRRRARVRDAVHGVRPCAHLRAARAALGALQVGQRGRPASCRRLSVQGGRVSARRTAAPADHRAQRRHPHRRLWTSPRGTSRSPATGCCVPTASRP